MIIIDASWRNSGGIGRFYQEVAKRLGNVKEERFSQKPASPIAVISNTNKCLFQYDKNQTVFFPGYIPPYFSRCSFSFTIHDLNHIERPENKSFLKSIFYNAVIRHGCKKAKCIFTVSEFSRTRIIAWSKVPAEKVINVGNGVDEAYNNEVAPYQPGYEYLLCVSNRKQHKNELRLIDAYFASEIYSSIKLVFTGNATKEIVDYIESKGDSSRVIFTGFLSDDLLPSLYKGSLGLVFPSLYEGFGLPVIEAMACGIPVLTSDTSSLPEVAGDAAILVNPESVEEISKGITRLVNEPELRNDLIKKGFIRAEMYTWDKVAQKILNALGSDGIKNAK